MKKRRRPIDFVDVAVERLAGSLDGSVWHVDV